MNGPPKYRTGPRKYRTAGPKYRTGGADPGVHAVFAAFAVFAAALSSPCLLQ